MLLRNASASASIRWGLFQWAPTLGGECYRESLARCPAGAVGSGFNGHPPLGVNATTPAWDMLASLILAGEFQWAPTLGGECYVHCDDGLVPHDTWGCFNGHPPLGVNATTLACPSRRKACAWFQWAPTLGGECYSLQFCATATGLTPSFNGHPPLGVNATRMMEIADILSRPLEEGFQWAPTLGGECYG